MWFWEGYVLEATGGKGVSDLTIREICNLWSWYHVKSLPSPESEDDPSVEEQVELFAEKIWQQVPAEVKAEKLMRERLVAMGIDPDVKPEISPELAAKMAESAERSNDDLYFSGDLHKGTEFKGKPVRQGADDFE